MFIHYLKKIKDAFKLLDIVSLLIGILGIALSIYFYYAGLFNRDMNFIVDDAVNIYNNTYQTTSIRINRKNGKPFDGNLYARTVTFINTSDIDLNKSSIIKPITFYIDDEEKEPKPEIIDVQISRGIGIDSSNFNLKYFNELTACQFISPCFMIEWNILNRGFGAEMVIFYTGRSDNEISVNNNFIITGIDHVYDDNYISNSNLYVILALIWIIIVIILAVIASLKFTIKSFKMKSLQKIIFSILISFIVMLPIVAAISFIIYIGIYMIN